MNIKIISLLFLFISFFENVVGQTNIESVIEEIAWGNTNNPQEKIHLHLDKSKYAAGETIWFKAYVTVGIENLLSALSSVVYIELFSPSNDIIKSMAIPLTMGIGYGSILLEDISIEGTYQIRAYTRWMLNADPTHFYNRLLNISNGIKDGVLTHTKLIKEGKRHELEIEFRSSQDVLLGDNKITYTIFNTKVVKQTQQKTTLKDGKLYVPLNNLNREIEIEIEKMDKTVVRKYIRLKNLWKDYDVQLFAEGGHLLAEKVNNIAVKAINENGLGVKSKILIISGIDTVKTIVTNALGMGSGQVLIKKDKSYRAVALLNDNNQKEIPFPKIEESGYSVIVRNTEKDILYAELQMSDDNIDGEHMYLLIHHLGEVYNKVEFERLNNRVLFKVDKRNLPNGVLSLTVLDNQFNPVLQRAFFNYQDDKRISLKVELDKKSYTTREKVNVGVEIDNLGDSLNVGTYSAVVLPLNAETKDFENEPNIYTSLLLKGDIKGYIQDPGSYFKNTEVRLEELDLLMTTQGWRSYDWSRMDRQNDTKYSVEKGLTIAGYTKDVKEKKMVPNAKVTLWRADNILESIDTLSDESGYFEFKDVYYNEAEQLLLNAKVKDSKVLVQVKEINEPMITTDTFDDKYPIGQDINRKQVDYTKKVDDYLYSLEQLGLREKTIELETVTVNRTSTTQAAPHSQNINGPGKADQVVGPEELENAGMRLADALGGRLTGVNFKPINVDGMHIMMPFSNRGGQPMAVLYDGVWIDRPTDFYMIDSRSVESVEVLKSVGYTTLYGAKGVNGILVITSKNGLYMSRKNQKNRNSEFKVVRKRGFHIPQLFYKPKYEPNNNNKIVKDLRTTIHWEPNLVINGSGKATFDFYTSDESGEYVIIVEGLDIYGKINRTIHEVIIKNQFL